MQTKQLALVLIIMVLYGSAYPVGKLGTLDAPPLLLKLKLNVWFA